MTDSSTTSEIPEIDLSETEPVSTSPIRVPTPAGSTLKTYDPSQEREEVRGWLALGLLGLIIGIVLISLICYAVTVYRGTDREWLKDWFGAIFTPILTLFGTVTGFYFGEKSRE